MLIICKNCEIVLEETEDHCPRCNASVKRNPFNFAVATEDKEN